MRFFLRAAMAELSAVWRGKRALAMLIALPVCVCLVSVIVPDDVMEPAVPVGWSMSDGCETGRELLEHLRETAGGVEFFETDEATLRRKVASGEWECGFVLREDFDERVAAGRYGRLFTLVSGEGSTMQGLVSEAVSAAMLAVVAPQIGSDYLESVGAVPPEGGWELEPGSRLEIEPASGEPAGSYVSSGISRSLLRGCAAVLLTVSAVSFGDELARRRREGYFRRIAAVRGEASALLPALAVRFALSFAAAAAALAAAGIWEPGLVAALCFALTAFAAVLSVFPDGWSAAVLPFLPAAMLVLCPVLFDVSEFMPALGRAGSLLAATHYLRGDVLPLVMQGCVFLAAAWLLDRCFKKI